MYFKKILLPISVLTMLGNPLILGACESLSPPDNRPIYEWAADNVMLVGGKGAYYDPDVNPSQRFAFDWIGDPDVKNLALVWPTGFGKSVFFEAWIAHIVSENPSDCQFSHQTDKPATQWVEKRVVPTLENCAATAEIMRTTHRHKKRKLELALANGCTLYFGGANMRNLQDKSLPVVGGQETWDWVAGMIEEAKGRTHDRFDEKMVWCGQGGLEGSDFEAEALGGALYETGYRCPKCKAHVPYMPHTDDPKADFEASIYWDKALAEEEKIRWSRLLRTVRLVTPCCGHRFTDTPTNRRRLALAQVLIGRPSESAIPGWITHTASALAAHWIPWSKLVTQYIKAHRAELAGDNLKMRAFVMKRLARFWSDKPATPELLADSGERYSRNDYWPKEGEAAPRWSREVFRFLTVDVQGDHFFAVVRAFRLNGDSRLLYEGRVPSVELVRELQMRFEVSNENVGIDSGFEPERVAEARWKYRDEVRIDGKVKGFACWVCLKGDKAESFPHHEMRSGNKKTFRKCYSPATAHKTSAGIPYQVTKFSNLICKNSLAAAMAHTVDDGRGNKVPSGRFGFFYDHSEGYGLELQSEAKLEVSPGVFRWVKVNKKGKVDDKVPNHRWDCETMQIAMGSLRGVLSPGLEEEEE